MKVTWKETFNTGGGCMVGIYTVDNSLSLKSIVVSDDCICGYANDDPFAYDGDLNDIIRWSADSWYGLIKIIGVDSALDVYRQFKEYWPWPTALNDERLISAVNELVDFNSAACMLSNALDELNTDEDDTLKAGYPFKESFQDIVNGIYNWQQAVIDKIQ